MSNNFKTHLKYAIKIQKIKQVALKVKNFSLASIYDQLLAESEVRKYASYVFAQTTVEKPEIKKPRIEVIDDIEDDEIYSPEEIEDNTDPFPNRINPSIFPSISNQDIINNDKNLENELKNSISITPENEIKITDHAKVQKVFAILFLKYGEELIRVAVAHFMGLPSSIRNWAISPIVPQELVNRYNNKLMQETAIQNIIRLRGKLGFDPKQQIEPGRFAPSEVEESVIGQEIIDRTMEVLLNKNGIYLGNIEKLVGYMITGDHQKEEYQLKKDKLPKDATENLKQLDINVDPNSFDGRFLQGLGKLVFTVVAQQFLERWGAVSYNQDSGTLKYRHLNKELYHPSGQISFEDPTFGNPALRNIFQFVPTQGKRHDINLQDEQEFILRKIFDINESGQQAFNELYDSRVNKSDQQYLGQHLAVDAKMLAQKIVKNFENLFGRYDEQQNEILKPSGGAFKALFAFYLQIMSWLKEGKGGFQSENTSTVKVPTQMFDYLGVKYDKNKVDNSDTMVTEDGEVTYQNDYVPIKPFGMDPSSARAIWLKNMNSVLGVPTQETNINRAETPREIYKEIFLQLSNIKNKEQLDAMNRVLANELKNGIEQLFAKKLGQLIELRHKSLKNNNPTNNPEWNKPGKSTPPEQHAWAEYAAVLYALINNIKIISDVAPIEIINNLKANAQEVFNKQL